MKFARLAFLAHLVSSSPPVANAFVAPRATAIGTGTTASAAPARSSTTSISAFPIDVADAAAAADNVASSLLLSSTEVDTGSLTTYFLEQLIASGVPALFWVIVIGFAGKTIASAAKEEDEGRFGGGPGGAVQEL